MHDDCHVLSLRPSLVTDSLLRQKCRLWLFGANATQRNDERSLTVQPLPALVRYAKWPPWKRGGEMREMRTPDDVAQVNTY